MIITNPADYLASRAVSFSWLKRFEADEDSFYRRFVLGEVSDEDEEESRALAVGTAAHCLILEGPVVFAERFVVHPAEYEAKGGVRKKWNKNAKVCELWSDAQEDAGRSIISPKEMDLLAKMRAAVQANAEAASLLDGAVCELAIRRDYPSLGFQRQGRLDLLNRDKRALGDVKTIENLNDRARVREQRQYFRQLPYYDDLASEEFAEGDYRQFILWLEKRWPYRCTVEWLSPDLVTIGRCKNYESLMRLAERFREGSWKIIPQSAEIGPSAEMLFDQMESAHAL
jgi:hypothetical protein